MTSGNRIHQLRRHDGPRTKVLRSLLPDTLIDMKQLPVRQGIHQYPASREIGSLKNLVDCQRLGDDDLVQPGPGRRVKGDFSAGRIRLDRHLPGNISQGSAREG